MTVYEALAMLELKIPVNHADVRKAFRSKARQYHPDKYTDPALQQLASGRFINAKRANDLLMSMTPEQINSRRHYRPASQVKRRPVYKQKPVKSVYPIVKELDNIARLVYLINKQGKSTKLWKFILSVHFNPSELLGTWYLRLIEKAYPGEAKLRGLSFFLLRSFRLFTGTLMLIIGFFALSVIGLSLMVVFAPPLMLFLGLYEVYRVLVSGLTGRFLQVKFKKLLPAFLGQQLMYLMVRSLPVVLLLLITQVLILFSYRYSIYLQSMAWIFLILQFMLLLSISYEWIVFFRDKKNA